MARRKDFIPNRIAEFFGWQNNLVSRVAAKAVAWAIAALKVTALQDAQTTYVALYNAANNLVTRTKGTIQAHKDGRKTYQKVIRAFVKENIKGNPLVTNEDRVDMGLPPEEGAHGFRPVITTAPFPALSGMGNYRVRFEFRVEGDSTRPSIHPDADGIEIRGMVGDTPPTSLSQATNMVIKKRARFFQTFEMEQAGKNLYLFARWVNLSDETKNGPWCPLATVVIR